ncbi:hypothetical protein Acid345_1964 [Candidatus Koribacter versatilis Ellin345]|uniref:Uncharacterized protein n=1 Tax=Koribacter versatilis (strain Ellin345) TaxID=204669 RepID=Q1IQ85_KORVE|nr:hypothetical protein [Candidatus Koribacter versatilis]ABF40965.1 hypothetical protein Acid345_1964 [Candidatus Koribacter versatilis Ellin345]
MKRALLALVAGLLLPLSAFAQSKSGLLLTTAAASSDAGQSFHSYWIVRDGSQVQVTEGNRLLTPRGAGWWELGITVLKHPTNESRNEVIWAGPAGSKHLRFHVIAFNPDEPCPDDINTYSLSWVGGDYATVQHAYVSNCGKKPTSGIQGFMVRLEDLTHGEQQLRAHIALRDVASDPAGDAMALGGEIANARGTLTTDSDNPVEENSWIVVRNKGRYQLLGVTPEIKGQEGNTFDIPFDVPKEIAGRDDLAVGWDAVLDKDPETLDAYTSPDGSFVALVGPRYLSCYELADGKLGARLTRVPLASAGVVAAQWASDVEQWNQQLVPLLKAQK